MLLRDTPDGVAWQRVDTSGTLHRVEVTRFPIDSEERACVSEILT